MEQMLRLFTNAGPRDFIEVELWDGEKETIKSRDVTRFAWWPGSRRLELDTVLSGPVEFTRVKTWTVTQF